MRSLIGRRFSALLFAMAATFPVAAPSLAQPATAPTSETKTDPLCAAHGPGFTRLAGSQTCVKISSSIQTDATGTDVSRTLRSDPLAPALKSK